MLCVQSPYVSLSVRFSIAENGFKLQGAWRNQYYKSKIKMENLKKLIKSTVKCFTILAKRLKTSPKMCFTNICNAYAIFKTQYKSMVAHITSNSYILY